MKADRTVVITGAAGGMGAAFVRRFLDGGAVVIATSTSDDSLAKLAEPMDNGRLHTRSATSAARPRPRVCRRGMRGRAWGRIVSIWLGVRSFRRSGASPLPGRQGSIDGLSRSLAREFGVARRVRQRLAPGVTATAKVALPHSIQSVIVVRRLNAKSAPRPHGSGVLFSPPRMPTSSPAGRSSSIAGTRCPEADKRTNHA